MNSVMTKMKKMIVAGLILISLTGCEKMRSNVTTFVDGYAIRCIDGTQYVLLTSANGNAITPHVGTDGKPKGYVEVTQ